MILETDLKTNFLSKIFFISKSVSNQICNLFVFFIENLVGFFFFKLEMSSFPHLSGLSTKKLENFVLEDGGFLNEQNILGLPWGCLAD